MRLLDVLLLVLFRYICDETDSEGIGPIVMALRIDIDRPEVQVERNVAVERSRGPVVAGDAYIGDDRTAVVAIPKAGSREEKTAFRNFREACRASGISVAEDYQTFDTRYSSP